MISFWVLIMPAISNFEHFLLTEVRHTYSGYAIRMGIPVIPQKQRGQICKLNALSVVLNSLHHTYGEVQPFPIRKDKEPLNWMSIRQLAKTYYGSKVGEVYSAKILAAIAADCGFKEVTISHAVYFDDYVKMVTSTIEAGELPILFYDIDENGEPAKMNSFREHATVVAGYFINKNAELCFIVSQWGKFYWAKAEDIFDSASQLSPCRKPEVFYKYGAEWYCMNDMKYYPPELFAKPPSERRAASALPEVDGGLKNKIVIVRKPRPAYNHSFWSQSLTALTPQQSDRLFTKYLVEKNIISEDQVVESVSSPII